MRIVVQRVKNASVVINKQEHSSINSGLLCFVGFCDSDTEVDFMWVLNKLFNLKLFRNSKSLIDINGQLLIVSQFTLFGSIRKGMRPSWSKAAKADCAKLLYDQFIMLCKYKKSDCVKTGVFGADMQIESINDGPVTLIIDTKNRE
tara:strand:+ start:179 stop:616 length:438 start_codon:yes stop_codon:yes gene_type:complete